MRKSALELIILMLKTLGLTLPIQLMVAHLVNWNMKHLMQLRLKLRFKEKMFTLELLREQ